MMDGLWMSEWMLVLVAAARGEGPCMYVFVVVVVVVVFILFLVSCPEVPPPLPPWNYSPYNDI
jgi:hypothetical protein